MISYSPARPWHCSTVVSTVGWRKKQYFMLIKYSLCRCNEQKLDRFFCLSGYRHLRSAQIRRLAQQIADPSSVEKLHRNMDSFASHLLFLSLTILVILVPVGVQSQGDVMKLEANETRESPAVHRHRRRLRTTPEDAIRRQIERVKDKILSQLSYSVWTAPASGSVRSTLPQALLHMYDIDMARQRAVAALTDTDDPGRSEHGIQTNHPMEYDSKHKQAKLIVFGHESKCLAVIAILRGLNLKLMKNRKAY